MKQNKPEIIKRGNRYFLKTVPTAFKYTFSNPDTGISKDLEFHHMTGIYQDGNQVIVDREYFTSNFIKYGGKTYNGYSVPNTDKWNIIGLDGTYSYREFREIAITVRTHVTDEDLTDTGNIIITGMDLTNHIYKKNLTQECKSMFYNYAKDLKSYVRSTLLSKGLTPNYNYYVISQPEEFDITFIFDDLYNESINISQKRINVIAKNNLILNQDSDVLEYIEEIPLEIIFYKNSAENNRVDKNPLLVETLRLSGGACKFRDNISKISPSFEIEYKGNLNANYCYIPIFNRYYYINDIIAVRNNLWSIDCSCDTLMSFKDKILDIECFVSRNEFQSSPEIPDEHFTVNIKRNIDYSEIEQSGSFSYNFDDYYSYYEREAGTDILYISVYTSPQEYTKFLAYEPIFDAEIPSKIVDINTEKPITSLRVLYKYFFTEDGVYTYGGTVRLNNMWVSLEEYYKSSTLIEKTNIYNHTFSFDRTFYQNFNMPEYFNDLNPTNGDLDKGIEYKVLSQNYVILVSGKSNIANTYSEENLKGGVAPLSNTLRALIVNQPTLIKILSQVYSSTFAENKSLLFQTLNGTIQGIFAYPFTVLGNAPFIYSVEKGTKTKLKLGLADLEIDNDFYVSIYDIPQETKELTGFLPYDYDFSNIGNNINGFIQIIKSNYFTIPRHFDNYLDYNPYTDYSLYLPYYGTYNLKVNDLLDKQIRIIYAVNILTKQTNIYITADNKPYDVIECEIGFDIPFSESNRNEQKRNLLFGALSAGISLLSKGGVSGWNFTTPEEPKKFTPKTRKETAEHTRWREKRNRLENLSSAIGGIGTLAGSTINNLPSFATTGEAKVSGMLSLLDPSKFYLIRYKPDPIVKDENLQHYNRLFGQPYFAYAKLSTLRGFTVVSAIHIEDLDTALSEEKEDIENRLLAGVILPYEE